MCDIMCCGGRAIRKRVRATYSGPGGKGELNFSVWIPKRATPAPVFRVFGPQKLLDRKPTEWGILSAWAWGMSRVLDWVETEPLLDAKRAAARTKH